MFYNRFFSMLRQVPRWALNGLRHPGAITFVLRRSALGDTLMLAALARELKRISPGTRIAIASSYPELFINNPHVDESRDWHLLRTAYTVQAKYHAADLTGEEHAVRIRWRRMWEELVAAKHPLAHAGTPEMPTVHPDIFLTDAERQRGRELARGGSNAARPVVLIGCGGKLKPTHNREWGLANFQAVAEALAPCATLIQISGEQALSVRGATLPDMRRLPIREAAALMAAAHATLVQEGGLMHVARAVNAPTVAIFGGYVWPSQTGYAEQVNLAARPECSPCITGRANCAHLKCMVAITPRRVLDCIRRLLEPQGFALPAGIAESLPDIWTPPDFVDRAALTLELQNASPHAAVVRDKTASPRDNAASPTEETA